MTPFFELRMESSVLRREARMSWMESTRVLGRMMSSPKSSSRPLAVPSLSPAAGPPPPEGPLPLPLV